VPPVVYFTLAVVFVLHSEFAAGTVIANIHSSKLTNLSALVVVCRSAILHGYKHIYGKVVLDVGAGTGGYCCDLYHSLLDVLYLNL